MINGRTDLIALAIIALFLAVLGLVSWPMYQNVQLRDRITPLLHDAQELTGRIGLYYRDNSQWPEGLEAVGADDELRGEENGATVAFDSGAGELTLTLTGAEPLAGKRIVLTPQPGEGEVVWRCRAEAIPPQALPRFCRPEEE